MVAASFRFYAELNDFLPSIRRHRRVGYACPRHATVKNAIENMGVPHTEIELILVNGVAVDFSHSVADGDSIAVYPKFQTLGVAPVLDLRLPLPRYPRFLADAHLGGLARYLRMLGFDTCYDNTATDRQIAGIAASEQRVVLTRDRDLLMHRTITHGCFVRGERPREQLRYVMNRFDLAAATRQFSRCLRCNWPLLPIAKDAVRERLPMKTAIYHEEFWTCERCRRVYWKGSHWERMSRFLTALTVR